MAAIIGIGRLWDVARRNLPSLAPALMLATFPVGELYRQLIAAGAIAGLVLLVRRWRTIIDFDALRWMLLLFLSLWVPQILSLVDAVDFDRSISTVLRYLMYPLAGVLVILFAARYKDRIDMDKVLYGLMVVMLLWSLDSIVQVLFGRDPFGFTPVGGRATGLFYPRVAQGLVLAALSPLYFEALRRLSGRTLLAWVLLAPFIAAIVLSGIRGALVLLTFTSAVYGGYWIYQRRDPRLVLTALVVLAAVGGFTWQSDTVRDRIERLSSVTSGDYVDINEALSQRWIIWDTGWRMFEANPVTGVGVRAFRSAYEQYKPDYYDEYRKPTQWTTSSPHLVLLEVAAETGVVGLFGYALFFGLLLRWSLRRGQDGARLMPYFLTVAAAAFPLNVSLPLFAHFMSALLWCSVYLVLLAWSRSPRYAAPGGER
jgi:O-antigen ligase